MTPPSLTTTITPDELKAAHRDMWASGDYAAVAQHIDRTLPGHLQLCLPALRGLDVLDVATGSGNMALGAARAGGRVTGSDLVAELLDVADRRARDEDLDVDWVLGDCEDLPFADASFDVVTSVVGVQFAPRHEVTAAELLRVCRPGGTIGLVNWTPEGLVGRLFGILGRHLPPAPAFASPPPAWGDEEHVRSLFGDAVQDLTFERGRSPFVFGSLEDYATFFEDNYGPTIKARERLGEEAWEACRAEQHALFAQLGSTASAGFTIESEYVVITARRA